MFNIRLTEHLIWEMALQGERLPCPCSSQYGSTLDPREMWACPDWDSLPPGFFVKIGAPFGIEGFLRVTGLESQGHADLRYPGTLPKTQYLVPKPR